MRKPAYAMMVAAFAIAALLTFSGAFIGCGGGGNDNENSLCGNGQVDSGERCDDGNRQNGDGCSSDCLEECFPAGQQRVVCTVGQFCCAVGDARQCLPLGTACVP